MEEITNKTNDLKKQEIQITNIKKVAPYLDVELSNNRKFISNGTLVQEISEYEAFIKVIQRETESLLIMKKDFFENAIINFQTKEILTTYSNKHVCHKETEDILEIGDRLFSLTTRDYIPNPPNLTPYILCVLNDNLFLFETNEEIMKREFVLVNKNGEIVYNCQKMFPQYFDNHIILRDKDILRIIPYQNGKLDFEKEKKIKENKILLHYLEGKIYQIKEQALHIMDLNLSLQNKIALPPFDTVIFSEIEFNKLTIGLKKKNTKTTLVMNLKTGKYIETVSVEVLHFGVKGPIKNHTIALSNFHHTETNREIYTVKIYDENLKLLFETDDVLNCKTNLNKKEDKIWLKKQNSGIIYDFQKKNFKVVNYETIYFQKEDNNNDEEYGFGITIQDQKLQIFDEDFNLLIQNVPYEQLEIPPAYGQFSYRYLNGYLLIAATNTIFGTNQITKSSIIDYDGNILYDKYYTCASAVGHYFQIQEKEQTIYFDTFTGTFSTKSLTLNNNNFLIEDKNNFTIDENGELKLIQKL